MGGGEEKWDLYRCSSVVLYLGIVFLHDSY